jgi:Arc/MetJ-type ribon-helix-helix transcriptional regulator
MKHIKLFEDFSEENMLNENATKWTPEKIRKEIEEGNYESRIDLKNKNRNLYNAALKNNMLDEFFGEKTDIWTPEKIRKAIEEGGYEKRIDLQKKNPALHKAALRYKIILDELFGENTDIRWTPEKIRKAIEEGDYEKRIDLRKKNLALYKAALKRKMLDEFFDKYTPPKMRPEKTEWTAEKIREEIKKGNYKSKSDLVERNRKLYRAAAKYGVLYEFFEEPENFPRKWTPEKIRKEIEEGGYEKRSDLEEKNLNLYNAALYRNMLDEFFGENAYRKWTPEKIREEIKKGDYKKRSDLIEKNYGLYRAALKYKILDEFFDKKNDKT